MSRWFRHYAGMMRDEKLVSIAIRSKQPVERVVWIWGAILESAAEIDDGGRFELDATEVAYFLRADQTDIEGVVAALEVAGRIIGPNVAKWGERQFQSDRKGGESRGSEPYVYFIGESWASEIKIGYSRNPWSRLIELRTGNTAALAVLAAFKTKVNSEVEIHDLLKEHRLQGEWFRLPEEVVDTVQKAASTKATTYEHLLLMLRSQLRSRPETDTQAETETDIQPLQNSMPREEDFSPKEVCLLVEEHPHLDIPKQLSDLAAWCDKRRIFKASERRTAIRKTLAQKSAEAEGAKKIVSHATGPPLPVSDRLAAKLTKPARQLYRSRTPPN